MSPSLQAFAVPALRTERGDGASVFVVDNMIESMGRPLHPSGWSMSHGVFYGSVRVQFVISTGKSGYPICSSSNLALTLVNAG